MWHRLRRSRFAGRVTGLAGATVIAQCFGALALFLLTRALPPTQIGEYQVFQSSWALVASVSLLSYHSVLPHLDEARYRTLARALLVASGIVGASTIAVFSALRAPLAFAVGGQVLAAGFTAIAEMSNIRQERPGRIAFARLALSSANLAWVVVATVVLHWASVERVVHGQVALALVTGTAYAYLTFRGRLANGSSGLFAILVDKKDCALYYAPSELLGSLTLNLPTILIERYFGLALAGQFGVVLRFCGAPVTILSTTIGQVYHGALARAVRERARGAYDNFLRLRRALVGIGFGAGAAIFIVAPLVAKRVMGPSWSAAGTIAQALSPMYGAMIAVGPLLASFQVFEAQRAILLLQLASATIAAGAFVLAGVLDQFWVGVALYSLLVSIRYVAARVTISTMSRARLSPFDAEPAD